MRTRLRPPPYPPRKGEGQRTSPRRRLGCSRRLRAGPGGRRAADLLHLAQILDGDVAADEVARLAFDQRRLFVHADVAQEARTAGVEDAAGGRVGRARDLTLETD